MKRKRWVRYERRERVSEMALGRAISDVHPHRDCSSAQRDIQSAQLSHHLLRMVGSGRKRGGSSYWSLLPLHTHIGTRMVCKINRMDIKELQAFSCSLMGLVAP